MPGPRECTYPPDLYRSTRERDPPSEGMWSPSGISYRIAITGVNIVFPPLAVAMIAGPGFDCLMNCLLFLLAVVPAHVHGFYIACVYFRRRHKASYGTRVRARVWAFALQAKGNLLVTEPTQARKGQYPGGEKSFIRSRNVINGGLSEREAERRYWKEKGVLRSSSRRRSTSGARGRGGGGRTETAHRRDGSSLGRGTSVRSVTSKSDQNRRLAYGDQVARDGYGPPQDADPQRWYA